MTAIVPVAQWQQGYRPTLEDWQAALAGVDPTSMLAQAASYTDGRVATRSPLAVTATGTTTARAIVDFLADRHSPKEWGAVMDGVADDSVALADALAALRGTGAMLYIPAGARMLLGPAARLAGKTLILDGTGIIGSGGRDSGGGANGTSYGTRGSTILLTDAVAAPFVALRNWRLEGIVFHWPVQVEDASAPRSMPPLLTSLNGSETSAGSFCGNDVLNAWVVMDFTAASAAGGFQIHANRVFFLQAFMRLKSMPLESFVSNNQFSPNAFQYGCLYGTTFRLRDWAATQGTVFEITGDATSSVDGLMVSNNYVLGIGCILRMQGGSITVSTFSNNGFDAVPTVLVASNNAYVGELTFDGGQWLISTVGSPGVSSTGILVDATARPGSQVQITNIVCSSVNGVFATWRGPGGVLRIHDCLLPACNNAPGGTSDAIVMDATGARLSVEGCVIGFVNSVQAGVGIKVLQADQITGIVGNHFVNCSAPLYIGGLFAPSQSVVTGNASVATTGAWAYTGPFGGFLLDTANSWDKPVPGPSLDYSPSDGAMLISFAGVAKYSIRPDGVLIGSNWPASAAGLPSGAVWRDNANGGVLKAV